MSRDTGHTANQQLRRKAGFTVATKMQQFKRRKKRWKVDQVQLLLLITGVFITVNSVLSFILARRLNSQCFCR